MADLSATSTSLRPTTLDNLLRPEGSDNSSHHNSKHGYTGSIFGNDDELVKDTGFVNVSPVLSPKDYDVSDIIDHDSDSAYDNSFLNEEDDEEGANNSFLGSSKFSETVDEYADYNDPILSLIASDDISAHSLALVVRSLPLSDKPLIKYINRAHKVQEDLVSLLHMISTGWEFLALEKAIQLIIRPEIRLSKKKKSARSKKNKQKVPKSSNNIYGALSTDDQDNNHTSSGDEMSHERAKKFDTSIAKTVVQKALEFHQGLYELNSTIIEINKVLSSFTPMQYVSDAGVLLTNLSLKIIELKNKLSEKINVSYSQSKLIIMGSDLESLLRDFDNSEDSNDAASSIIDADHPIISNDLATTIEGYKDFVVTILNQLNEAREINDVDEINECLAVIGDLEKMFDALMKQVYDPDYKTTNNASSASANEEQELYENEVDTNEDAANRSDHVNNDARKNAFRSDASSSTAFADTDFSSPTNSATFDNDTLYDSDREYENATGRKPSVNETKGRKSHSRDQHSLSSSTTFGMSRSTSRDNFNVQQLHYHNHHYHHQQTPPPHQQQQEQQLQPQSTHHHHQFYNTGKTTLLQEMPYLLQAFDNAKEAEIELRESLRNNNQKKKLNGKALKSSSSLSRINSINDTSRTPTSPRKEGYSLSEQNELEGSYYPGMSASINIPSRSFGSDSFRKDNNLYSTSNFIRPPLQFKTSNPISASNPLIIKDSNGSELDSEFDTNSTASENPNTETNSASSSIFNLFGLQRRPALLPSASSDVSLSQSVPALPSTSSKDNSPQFLSHSVVLRQQQIGLVHGPPRKSQLPLNIEDDID